MTPKEKEIMIIEYTLKDIFQRDEIKRIDVAIANKLFEKWKTLTEYTECDEYPVLNCILDKEPNWKINK